MGVYTHFLSSFDDWKLCDTLDRCFLEVSYVSFGLLGVAIFDCAGNHIYSGCEQCQRPVSGQNAGYSSFMTVSCIIKNTMLASVGIQLLWLSVFGYTD